jgi:hypothetical protein
MRRLGGRPLLLGLAALAYAAFLLWYHCPYAGGADSSGYLNSARLLLSGRFTTPLHLPADLPAELLPREAFAPLGFTLDRTGRMLTPTYPVGLPLHFAGAGFFVGLDAGTTVIGVGSAIAFLLLLFATAREFGVRPGWAGGLAACAALSPLTLYYALQPMSDLVATVWILATVLSALRSARHPGWVVAGGLAFAMAVLVRPTNLLLLPAVLVALRPQFRTWLAFVAGGLPGAVFLAAYNHALYGGSFLTGYGHVGGLFAWRYVLPTLGHYALWVPVIAGPLIIAAAALPWVAVDRRRKAVLLLWAGVFTLFYSAYRFSHETWWYLRFILPALPAFAIGAVLALQAVRFPTLHLAARLAPSDPPAPDTLVSRRYLRLPVVWLLLLASAGWLFAWDRSLRVKNVELDERAYRLAGRWVAAHVPAESLVAASQTSGALLFYAGHPSLNWQAIPPATAERFLAWLDAEDRPLYAALFPFEEQSIQERLPGRWELIARFRQASVWRRTGPAAP